MPVKIDVSGAGKLTGAATGFSGNMTVEISGTPNAQLIHWSIPVVDAPSRDAAVSRALQVAYSFAIEIRLRAAEEHAQLETVPWPNDMLRPDEL